MKKISLITLMLMSLQQVTFAQTDFGFSFGPAIWHEEYKASDVKSPWSPGIKGGLFTERSILNKKFALRLALEYSYLFGKESDSSKTTMSAPHQFNYHQLTIPVHLVWNVGKFAPMVGVYYNIKKSTTQYTDADGTLTFDAEPGEKYALIMSHMGISGGINYNATEQITVAFTYRRGLYAPNERYHSKNNSAYYTTYRPINNQIDVSVLYTINKD